MPDVVVVGAGLAGLTAAFALKQRGFSVLVLEASPRIGGQVYSKHALVENTSGPLACCWGVLPRTGPFSQYSHPPAKDVFFERGCEGFVAASTAVADLCKRLNLENQLQDQKMTTYSASDDFNRLTRLEHGAGARKLGFNVARKHFGSGLRSFKGGMSGLTEALRDGVGPVMDASDYMCGDHKGSAVALNSRAIEVVSHDAAPSTSSSSTAAPNSPESRSSQPPGRSQPTTAAAAPGANFRATSSTSARFTVECIVTDGLEISDPVPPQGHETLVGEVGPKLSVDCDSIIFAAPHDALQCFDFRRGRVVMHELQDLIRQHTVRAHSNVSVNLVYPAAALKAVPADCGGITMQNTDTAKSVLYGFRAVSLPYQKFQEQTAVTETGDLGTVRMYFRLASALSTVVDGSPRRTHMGDDSESASEDPVKLERVNTADPLLAECSLHDSDLQWNRRAAYIAYRILKCDAKEVRHADVARWEEKMTVLTGAHMDWVHAIEKKLPTGMALAGSCYFGAGVDNAVVSGLEASKLISRTRAREATMQLAKKRAKAA